MKDISLLDRVLILDSVNRRIANVKKLTDIKELTDLTQKYMILDNPPSLTLDVRELPQIYFNSLLKFIEEYPNRLILIANDNPVSLPILSRFPYVEKSYGTSDIQGDIKYHKIMKGSLFISNYMKNKIVDFLGYKPQVEDDYVPDEDDDYEEY